MNCVGLGEGRSLVTKNSLKVSFGRVPNAELALLPAWTDRLFAQEFLTKKGYAWRNFHDGDGEIEKLVGRYGIPRTMLVDAQGKIAYDAEGMDEDELRKEIARLGLVTEAEGRSVCGF